MTSSHNVAACVALLIAAGALALVPERADAQAVVVASGAKGKVHLLPATLETTQWGWFNNAQAPVLRVDSGDTIVMETMMHSHNQVIPGRTIEEIKKLRTDFPGRGPHTLTGPIYINGAEPGDVLKVTLNKIVPRAYATNFNVPGMFGQFPKEYSDGQVKYMYLDLDRGVTEFLPGVYLPIRPFPGTLAVARKEPGQYSSVPPGEFAGSMDIRDFVAGSSLYVPVHVPGALLWSGDSHAGQGNGEVNLTAIETAYKEFNITVEVIKGKPLDFPRIETPKSWITMGFDQDLNKAGPGQGANRQVAGGEARRVGRSGHPVDADRVRLPRVAGGQYQEGHSLPEPEAGERQGRHGTADRRNGSVLRRSRQGRRLEQGHGRRLDGDDQMAGKREEDRAARCLWAGQRRHGLPCRSDLGRREERPLPHAEKHLAGAEMTAREEGPR